MKDRRIYKLHWGHVAYTQQKQICNNFLNENLIKIIDTNTGNEFQIFK